MFSLTVLLTTIAFFSLMQNTGFPSSFELCLVETCRNLQPVIFPEVFSMPGPQWLQFSDDCIFFAVVTRSDIVLGMPF